MRREPRVRARRGPGRRLRARHHRARHVVGVVSDDRVAELEARIAELVKAGDDLADAFTYSQNVQGTLTADLFTVRQWHAAKGKR